MNMWQYVRDYSRDTDFGGKTGTSNNHSDAWFVGVSPNLVCGAWVGGEYRCIHFRTGALGQGSRTALPICGLFMQSVLGDSRFRQYHGKFDKSRDENITRDMYETCSGVWTSYNDSIGNDSIGTYEVDATLNSENTPSTLQDTLSHVKE
jgi:penicillin-binding protein 1A